MKIIRIFTKSTWKSKAVSRSKENKLLNKRLKEISKSRDLAKTKNHKLMQERDLLRKENEWLQKELKKND